MASPAMALEPTYFERLVRGVAANDGAALEELWLFLKKTVQWQLFRRMGPQETDDLFSEVFLRVVDAIQKRGLTHPNGLIHFVRTVAFRTANRRIRELIGNRECSISPGAPEAVLDASPNAEEALLLSERRAIAMDALGALSGSDQDVLIRFYLWEQSKESIMRDRNMSDVRFRLKKSRALAKLKTSAVMARCA